MTKAEEKVLASRYIPEGYRLAQGITYTTQVYFKEYGDKYIALIFLGRAVKPTKHAWFRTEDERQEYVDNMLTNYQTRQARVAERKAERKAMVASGHGVQVGDFFYASWGYDQTNATFFQVTKLIGKTMVEVRQVQNKVVARPHFTEERVVPVKDAFSEHYKPMKKRVTQSSWGNASIKAYEFASASLWDGQPKYQTNPMFGH